ncbi:MAG: ABC transporter substrate-binding protein [Oscillospiraceae bacterium]|nr:ABC transporter substrate-binding protein [Oscillospiraceae bacterium]
MKTKKFLCFILSILISSSALLAACSTAKTSDTNTADTSDTAVTDASGNTEETTQALYQIPTHDYGGYNMRVLIPNHDDWAMSTIKAVASTDTGEEEENGDPLNDAIYKRNAEVEQGLNVKITEIKVSGPESPAKKAILAGSDDYDVVFTDSAQAGLIATQGLYLNLDDVPGLNLDQPYWSQNANQSAQLLGKLYFTTSDANIITNDAIWLLYFNKTILQNLGLQDPYALVRNGTWTIDAMYDMAKAATKDIDGDGKFTVKDQWGISTHSSSFLAFLEGQGEQLVQLDNTGTPNLVNPDDKFVNAFVKAHDFMDKTNGVYLPAQDGYTGSTPDLNHASKTFMANMSLFCGEVLAWARTFRQMTADFGLLPYPKYDANQSNYYTMMIDTVPAFGIPVTAPDPERTGTFMDAFTGASSTTIIPAYYTVSLEGKFTRDEDSIEMLNIIRDGRTFDLAILYNWGGFYSALTTYGMSVSGTNPQTVFDKNSGKVNDAIQKTLDAYNSMQ